MTHQRTFRPGSLLPNSGRSFSRPTAPMRPFEPFSGPPLNFLLAQRLIVTRSVDGSENQLPFQMPQVEAVFTK